MPVTSVAMSVRRPLVAAAAAHVDDSYYAGSPDSATGETGHSSDDRDDVRRLSPDLDSSGISCSDDGEATLDRFRKSELLRGRWVPFDKSYLERLFDCALREMNREILENERLASMKLNGEKANVMADVTCTKPGRVSGSRTARENNVKYAYDAAIPMVKPFARNASMASNKSVPVLFDRSQRLSSDSKPLKNRQSRVRSQKAADGVSDVTSNLLSSSANLTSVVQMSVIPEDTKYHRLSNDSTATKRKLAADPALTTNETEDDSSESEKFLSSSSTTSRCDRLPVIGPANNQWVIIEKNALMRCFEEVLAGDIRQARKRNALNGSLAGQAHGSSSGSKHRKLQGIKEPPRPSSAPIVLPSSSALPMLTRIAAPPAGDNDRNNSNNNNNDNDQRVKMSLPEDSSPESHVSKIMTTSSLNQFHPLLPPTFPINAQQPNPVQYQSLFPPYSFPSPFPPFSSTSVAATEAAAAAATAAYLASASGSVTGMFHDALPFMLSSFLMPPSPIRNQADCANALRAMLASSERAAADSKRIGGLMSPSIHPMTFAGVNWASSNNTIGGMEEPSALSLGISPHSDEENSDTDVTDKMSLESSRLRKVAATSNPADVMSNKRRCDDASGEGYTPSRKARLEDCDGWVAISKSKVHQMITDLLENDSEAHQNLKLQQQMAIATAAAAERKSLPPVTDVVEGVNKLDVREDSHGSAPLQEDSAAVAAKKQRKNKKQYRSDSWNATSDESPFAAAMGTASFDQHFSLPNNALLCEQVTNVAASRQELFSTTTKTVVDSLAAVAKSVADEICGDTTAGANDTATGVTTEHTVGAANECLKWKKRLLHRVNEHPLDMSVSEAHIDYSKQRSHLATVADPLKFTADDTRGRTFNCDDISPPAAVGENSFAKVSKKQSSSSGRTRHGRK